MSESIHSSHWYRLAGLKPRLRALVRVQRRQYRDETWVVLTDPTHGRHHVIDESAYRLVGRFDGRRTVSEIWEGVCALAPDMAPTQDEFVALLVQLSQAELLQSDVMPDLQQTFKRQDTNRRRRRRSDLNPLWLRVSLGDPSGWLTHWTSKLSFLFHPLLAWGWLALVLSAVVLGIVNWSALELAFTNQALSTRFVVLTWCAFPVIKALHELAHALCVHHWGGEVRRAGFSLLLLTPVPFVDASAASEFPSKGQRVAVSAAGVAVELGLAALALWLWVLVEPGWVRDLALVVVAIGSLSTLLVNGNPLLRFDGYQVLCDALALPNLYARSRAFWSYMLRRWVLRVPDTQNPATAQGERKWMIGYAPLSWMFQVWMCVSVAMWVSNRSALLGLTLLGVGLFALIAQPLWKCCVYLVTSAEVSGKRRPAALGGAFSLLAVCMTLLWMPLPASTSALGLAWLPEQSLARVQTEGFVSAVHVRSGQKVNAGDALITLKDPDLVAQWTQARGELTATEVQYRVALDKELAKAQSLETQMKRRSGEVQRLTDQIDQLVLRAPVDGTVAIPNADDLVGRLARKGELLVYVFGGDDMLVKVAVPHSESVRVREQTKGVSAYAIDGERAALPGRLVGEVPAAGNRLPSAALGSSAGGLLETDPADKDGVQSIESVAVFDVQLTGFPAERLGTRLWVRFDHGLEPLAGQWGRQLRQLFLRHLDGDGRSMGGNVAQAKS